MSDDVRPDYVIKGGYVMEPTEYESTEWLTAADILREQTLREHWLVQRMLDLVYEYAEAFRQAGMCYGRLGPMIWIAYQDDEDSMDVYFGCGC